MATLAQLLADRILYGTTNKTAWLEDWQVAPGDSVTSIKRDIAATLLSWPDDEVGKLLRQQVKVKVKVKGK